MTVSGPSMVDTFDLKCIAQYPLKILGSNLHSSLHTEMLNLTWCRGMQLLSVQGRWVAGWQGTRFSVWALAVRTVRRRTVNILTLSHSVRLSLMTEDLKSGWSE